MIRALVPVALAGLYVASVVVRSWRVERFQRRLP